jgi:hypothetical protein
VLDACGADIACVVAALPADPGKKGKQTIYITVYNL